MLLLIALVIVSLLPNKPSKTQELERYYTMLELELELSSKPVKRIIVQKPLDVLQLPSLNDYVAQYMADDTFEHDTKLRRKRRR